MSRKLNKLVGTRKSSKMQPNEEKEGATLRRACSPSVFVGWNMEQAGKYNTKVMLSNGSAYPRLFLSISKSPEFCISGRLRRTTDLRGLTLSYTRSFIFYDFMVTRGCKCKMHICIAYAWENDWFYSPDTKAWVASHFCMQKFNTWIFCDNGAEYRPLSWTLLTEPWNLNLKGKKVLESSYGRVPFNMRSSPPRGFVLAIWWFQQGSGWTLQLPKEHAVFPHAHTRTHDHLRLLVPVLWRTRPPRLTPPPSCLLGKTIQLIKYSYRPKPRTNTPRSSIPVPLLSLNDPFYAWESLVPLKWNALLLMIHNRTLMRKLIRTKPNLFRE